MPRDVLLVQLYNVTIYNSYKTTPNSRILRLKSMASNWEPEFPRQEWLEKFPPKISFLLTFLHSYFFWFH